MPEGDTLAQAAASVGAAIVGAIIVDMTGSARSVARERRRMSGRTVESVRSVGKHLLIAFDNGWVLRTHLGMTGSWHVYAEGERWRISPGKARVVIRTAHHEAVCFAAPTVQLAPAAVVETTIGDLGPDLMDPNVDVDEVVRRIRTAPGPTIADVLLDQTVMAGVGNVYKSEVLFLQRLHPDTLPSTLDDATLRAVVEKAAQLLRANAASPARSTTGSSGRGRRLWVYDRARHGCRRCPDSIVAGNHGEPARVTYWCATCQPDPSSA